MRRSTTRSARLHRPELLPDLRAGSRCRTICHTTWDRNSRANIWIGTCWQAAAAHERCTTRWAGRSAHGRRHSKRLGDGLPETLPDWIDTTALHHIKIKLQGDDLGMGHRAGGGDRPHRRRRRGARVGVALLRSTSTRSVRMSGT